MAFPNMYCGSRSRPNPSSETICTMSKVPRTTAAREHSIIGLKGSLRKIVARIVE